MVYELDDQSSIPSKGKIFSSTPQHPYCSGGHPASCAIGMGDFSLRVK
jgi:hypothetical protein